jgi:hypothetical protein
VSITLALALAVAALQLEASTNSQYSQAASISVLLSSKEEADHNPSTGIPHRHVIDLPESSEFFLV